MALLTRCEAEGERGVTDDSREEVGVVGKLVGDEVHWQEEDELNFEQFVLEMPIRSLDFRVGI